MLTRGFHAQVLLCPWASGYPLCSLVVLSPPTGGGARCLPGCVRAGAGGRVSPRGLMMGGQEGRRGSQVDWRSGGQRRLDSRGPWAASEHGPQFPACGLKNWLAFSGAVSSAPPDKVLPIPSLWLRVPGTSTTHAHTHLLRPLSHPGALCFIPTLSLANSYARRKTSMRCPLSQKALLWPPLCPAHWSSCHLPHTLDIWQGVQATPRGRPYVPTPSSALCYMTFTGTVSIHSSESTGRTMLFPSLLHQEGKLRHGARRSHWNS